MQEVNEDEPICSFGKRLLWRDGCSFIEKKDTRMFYFGVTAFLFYIVFLLVILADLKYWWSKDKSQQQIFYYVDRVKRKLRTVQTQQRQLGEIRDNTNKKLKSNRSSVRLLQSIRGRGIQEVGSQELNISNRRYSVVTLTGSREQQRELWTPVEEDSSSIWGENALCKDEEFSVI